MAVFSYEHKEILLEKPRIQYDCCPIERRRRNGGSQRPSSPSAQPQIENGGYEVDYDKPPAVVMLVLPSLAGVCMLSRRRQPRFAVPGLLLASSWKSARFRPI
jgi:hypothetical protein